MKSTKQKKRNKTNHLKAITLTVVLHLAIIGGILYANGDLDKFFKAENNSVEKVDDQILSKALANTKPN